MREASGDTVTGSVAKGALLLGTLFRASQFLSEELPIRLAHRVQELGNLPDGLNDMPSIKKVQDWYSQSFEVRGAPLCSNCKLAKAANRTSPPSKDPI